MSDLLKKLEDEVKSLSKQERAFLADRLLSSLDGDVLNDVEEAWIAEAERRYKEYKEGKDPDQPQKRCLPKLSGYLNDFNINREYR